MQGPELDSPVSMDNLADQENIIDTSFAIEEERGDEEESTTSDAMEREGATGVNEEAEDFNNAREKEREEAVDDDYQDEQDLQKRAEQARRRDIMT